jgi:hypothetical protein
MPIRDSLSRCESNLYSNIYQVGRHPEFKPEAVRSTQPIHKDTIQISRDKMKKDALERLDHTSKYSIVQHGFMRIGKVLFLAVVLPPYMAIYRIPKWVLVEAIPLMISFFSPFIEKVTHPVKKKVQVIIHKVAQVIQVIQRALKEVAQPIIRLVLELRAQLQSILPKAFSFINRIRGKDKDKKGNSALGSPLSRLFKRTQQGLISIRNWLSDQTLSLWSPIRQRLLKIKSGPQKILKKGSQLKSFLKDHPFSKQFIAKFKSSKQIAQQATDWVFDKLGYGFKGINRIGDWVKNLYDRYVRPIISRLQSVMRLSSRKKSAEDAFNRKKKKILDWFHHKQERLQRLQAEHFFSYLYSKFSFLNSQGIIQTLIKKLLFNSLIENGLNQGLKGFSSLFSFLFKGVEGSIHSLEKGGHFFSHFFKNMSGWTIGFFQQTINILKNSANFTNRFARKAFYTSCVTVVMGGILTMWGFQLVKKISNRLISFRKPIQKNV